MSVNHSGIEKIWVFLQNTINKVIEKAGYLGFDTGSPQQLYSICLYGRILEIARSCLALGKAEQLVAIPILLRSVSEAYADLINLICDDSYYQSMSAIFYKEEIRLLKNIIKDRTNPTLMSISDDPDEELGKSEKELEKLKANDQGPIDISTKFKKAGLNDMYQLVYWRLCQHSHNNIRALINQYIQKKGEAYEVIFLKDQGLTNPLPYVDSLTAILIDSSLRIHRLLQTSAENDIQRLQTELEDLRNQYELPSDI